MKKMSLLFGCMMVVLGAAVAIPTLAQETTPPAQGGGGGGGGGFANFRQQLEDRMKQELGVTDDEFKAIQPKIEKVMTARRDASGMGGMFGGGRRRRGGDNADNGGAAAATTAPALSPAAAAANDLRTLLKDKDAKPEDIKAKLTALREARTKAQEALKAAQKDLADVLTQRQEAVLVGYGILE